MLKLKDKILYSTMGESLMLQQQGIKLHKVKDILKRKSIGIGYRVVNADVHSTEELYTIGFGAVIM